MNRAGDKQRFEINDGRIRALYGHSVQTQVERPPAEPPVVLYHGTADRTVPAILRGGLRPMRRQYVHLSSDLATAREVGQRHGGKTVILDIAARQAWQHGVHFYHGNQDTWLADPIPPEYISVHTEHCNPGSAHIE